MKWAALVVAVVGLAGSATGFGVKVDAHEEECFHDDLRVITPLLLDPSHHFFEVSLSQDPLTHLARFRLCFCDGCRLGQRLGCHSRWPKAGFWTSM